jgi:hypothetical protein
MITDMAIQRDSKLGYGFLLVGAALPYLADKLFGPIVVLVLAAIALIVGIVFLLAAHHDSLPKRRSLIMTIWVFTLYGAGIGALGGGIAGAIAHLRTNTTATEQNKKGESGASSSAANSPSAQLTPQQHTLTHDDVLQSGHKKIQGALSGNSNQQTITVHNAPVQTMIDSPGGIQAIGDVNITGKVTPPPRFISQSKFAAAVSILKTAPAGSKVSFMIVGGSTEITSITNQIKSLFVAAKDKWEILPGSFTGSLGSVEISDTGIQTFHGEGINCSFGTSETLAYRIGVRAMKAAGVPCGSHNFSADNSSADISIMIGTRIVPEE